MIPLETKLKSIREVIDIEIPQGDIDAILGKGNQLEALIGLSAECKAHALKRLSLKKLEKLNELQGQELAPSVLIKAIDLNAAEEDALFQYADRINAAVTHELDYMRTLISYYKEEKKQEYQPGIPRA